MKHRTKRHHYLRLIVIALCVLGGAALQCRMRVAKAANTITVTNTQDSGPGSLRQAIDNAADGDTINITATGTITLTSGTLKISRKLTINGPGAKVLTISGGQTFSVLEVGLNADVAISRVSISDGTIDPNKFQGSLFASGIANYGTLRLSESLVTRNHPFQGIGTAIANGGGLTITNCEIANNLCSGIGNVDVATITNSAIIDNTSFEGAGVDNYGQLDLTNTTISGNVATGGIFYGGYAVDGAGGGILAGGNSRISLTNCTITGNRANRGGGIITPPPDGQPVIKVKNTIIAGNFAPTGPDLAHEFQSEGHNLIGNNQGSTGFTHGVQGDLIGTPSAPLDPRLGPLQNKGGLTATHALLPNSPALDAGDNQGAPATDQRGRPRPVDGDGNLTMQTDIGAFEAQRTLIFNTDDSGPGSLRRAVQDSEAGTGGDILAFNLIHGLPATITLLSGELSITKTVGIVGPGADRLTISGNQSSRIFKIGEGTAFYLSGLTITGGQAEDGGAIYNAGNLVITGATLKDNRTTGSPGRGGAIFSGNGKLDLAACTISGNTALAGGGLYFVGGTATLTNCTLSGNTATGGSGGGIFNLGLPLLNQSAMTLTNCTLTKNSGVGGSAIRTENFTFGPGAGTEVRNCLVADNGSPNLVIVGTGAALHSLGNNLDSDGTSGFTHGANGDLVGTDSNKIDARLGPLQNNSGPTFTHALLAGSPAIDRGSNAVTAPPLNLSTDQRGLPRAVDGDGDHTSTVDIGAFEFTCSSPRIITQPSSHVVCLGATAGFSVAASGTELGFQWRKNGQNINGATSASLTITSVTANDNASYDVMITSPCGNLTSQAATLTVVALPAPPAITPASASVCASSTGNSASTTATGVSYKWTIINGTINSADDTPSIVYTAGSRAHNSGNVTLSLTVTSGPGCAASNSVNVPINTSPVVVLNPTNTTVCAGGTATFNALTSGNPTPSVQWQVSTNGGASFSNINGATSTTLSFTATTADQGKQYRAVFTNLCYSSTSSAATLSIRTPLSISTQPVSQQALFGAPVSFSVVASGGGALTYQWRKNGVEIPGATSSSYAINSAKLTDAGNYDVLITGPCNTTTSQSVTLVVNLGLPGDVRFSSDFDGDGKADLAIWRPSTATFWIYASAIGSTLTKQLGATTDVPVPSDYDGDGKTDFALWRPSTGNWIICQSTDGATITWQWGNATDVPVPGDYDGDGKSDLAVWRPSTGNWMIFKSSGGTATLQWGAIGDRPVPGDYDGDGQTDLAIWRPSTASFWIYTSVSQSTVTKPWGVSTDVPVVGDYDGDGKCDLAVRQASTGVWTICQSTNGAMVTGQWGNATDIPVPGDYDGDGQTDLAIWRPSTGVWWIYKSTGGTVTPQWGTLGDRPVR